MNMLKKAKYVLTPISFLVLVFSENAVSKELETFLQDNNFSKKGNVSVVIENGYHFHDIEDDSNDLEYEYENNSSSLGVGYSIDNFSVIRGSYSYAYNTSRSAQGSFLNDPVFSYWRRVSIAESLSDTSGDVGIEIIPLLSTKYSKQAQFGNSAALKYRFSLGDENQNIQATYFLGVQEGRSFIENGESRGVSSNVFYGLDLGYEYLFTESFSIGGRLGLGKNSENSGTAYFVNSEFSSSWEASFNFFLSCDFSKKYNITLNYLSSDEGPSANKFKKSRDLEVEEKRILISLGMKYFEF